MNQSKTKTKVLMVAIIAIMFACSLLVIGIIEIKQYHTYQNRLFEQEKLLEDLYNKKNYYNSNNYDENASRDNNYSGNNDLIFEEM